MRRSEKERGGGEREKGGKRRESGQGEVKESGLSVLVGCDEEKKRENRQ